VPRILSPIFATEHIPARHRTELNKSIRINDVALLSTSHFIARESVDLQYKVAPKVAPDLVPDVALESLAMRAPPVSRGF
jgi:hypothetical protein